MDLRKRLSTSGSRDLPDPDAAEGDFADEDSLLSSVPAESDPDGDPDSVRTVSAISELEPDPWSMSVLASETAAEQLLTVEQVLQMALSNHPLLRAREHEVDIARARLVGAGLLDNPQLVMDTESPVYDSDPTSLTTRVTFTIPIGGKLRRRKAVARAGIQRAQCALSRETEAVLVEAADAALEVMYLQELVELRTELGELAAKGAEIQKGRFEAMAITFADKIEADVDAAAIELDRRNTAAQLNVARMRLSRAVGLTTPRMLQIEGQLVTDPVPPVPLETILATARRHRPELAEADAAVAQSAHELDLAYAEAKPDLVIGPRYQDRLGVDNDDIGARISVDVPLFDRNQDGIRERIAQVGVSRARSRVAELTTLSDVATAYLELTSLQSSLQYYESHVMPLAERTEVDFLKEFGGQAIAANQVSDLLREFVRMRVSHLNLRYRCDRLRTRLELFLGCRFADLQPDLQADPPEDLPLDPPGDFPVDLPSDLPGDFPADLPSNLQLSPEPDLLPMLDGVGD